MTKEVYVIKQGKYCKIGVSKSPLGRMTHMQTSSPVKLKMIYRGHGGRKAEKAAHKALREYRVSGEWFLLPKWIIKEIKKLKSRKDYGSFVMELHGILLMGGSEKKKKASKRVKEEVILATPESKYMKGDLMRALDGIIKPKKRHECH